MGDDIDLMAFPATMAHKGDGAMHIGTRSSIVIKDPDSGAEFHGTGR